MSNNPLTRREFLKLVGAGSAALAVADRLDPMQAFAASPARRPNILVILADDQGYHELGCQGNTDIPTPNIDSIAKNGVRFTDGHVSCPVCSPTRAGLMTGRYQQRFGHEFNPGPPTTVPFGLPLSETTLASRLQSAGYKTGMVGKWHLGNQPEYVPTSRGFDEFFGFLPGANAYMSKVGPIEGLMRGKRVVSETEYLTDAFAREAVSFIDRQKENPFFLYLPFNAVHNPLQAPDKYLNRFSSIADEKRRTFAAMTSALDDAVGKVLAKIRDSRLENDTLIFYLSDNGGPTPITTSNNTPLRGYKAQVWEGGIRVPYMIQWKGHVPAGKTDDRPVISLDIAPTALAAAGVKAKDAKFDGVDLMPYIKGKAKGLPHQELYWRYGSLSAIRAGDWKLVDTPAGGTQLYNLKRDISETTDLAAKNPEKLKELDEKLTRWDSELATPLWGPRTGRRSERRKLGTGV